MEECIFCKGTIEEREIEHVHQWEDRLYIFRNVPAEVCTQCGEVFFGPEALKSMDRVVRNNIESEEHVQVPVYSL